LGSTRVAWFRFSLFCAFAAAAGCLDAHAALPRHAHRITRRTPARTPPLRAATPLRHTRTLLSLDALHTLRLLHRYHTPLTHASHGSPRAHGWFALDLHTHVRALPLLQFTPRTLALAHTFSACVAPFTRVLVCGYLVGFVLG